MRLEVGFVDAMITSLDWMTQGTDWTDWAGQIGQIGQNGQTGKKSDWSM